MRAWCVLALLAGCSSSPEGATDDLAMMLPATADLAAATDADTGDGGGGCAIDGSGSLLDLVDAIVTAMRAGGNAGSGALVVPAVDDRDAFAARVVAILGGDEAQACGLPVSYRLLRLPNLRVVAELDASGDPRPPFVLGHHAAPVIPPVPGRLLVVEAPHPIFDTNTEIQAADLFVQAAAATTSSPARIAAPTPTRVVAPAPPRRAARPRLPHLRPGARRCSSPSRRSVHARSPEGATRPSRSCSFMATPSPVRRARDR